MNLQQGETGAHGAAVSSMPEEFAPRSVNERLLLTLLHRNGPMAKAEIARTTGLSAQSVSVIMRGLEAEGLLVRGEPLRGKVGQPQVPMRLAAAGAYFLGLKVGRRSLDLVLVDFNGTVIGRQSRSHRFPDPDGVVRFADEAIAGLLAGLQPEARGRVMGLGIAVPFRLWEWAEPLGVAPAEMDAWHGRDIRAEIAPHWPFPVYLQNDASAACGAELVYGGDTGPAGFLYFFIGFFIGGGVVLNHRLYPGPTGNAGALGSMPVLRGDGRRVQLVDLASLKQLEEGADAAGADGGALWERPEGWDLPEDLVSRWVGTASAALAQAIVAASSVIDFAETVIDGWLPSALRDRLVAATAEQLAQQPHAGIGLPIVRAGRVGSDARAMGAASLPLSERFLLDLVGPEGP